MLEKVNDGVVSAHAKDENALMLMVGGDYSVGVRCYFLLTVKGDNHINLCYSLL